MMERVSDEWLSDMIKLYGGFAEKVILCTKELQARRRTEKEQGYTDISTGDKKLVQAKLESVKPIPVKNIDGVDVKTWTLKRWFQKINDELDELKEAVVSCATSGIGDCHGLYEVDNEDMQLIADEAADVITVITSMMEALGLDEDIRNDAQTFVNEMNRERGRL